MGKITSAELSDSVKKLRHHEHQIIITLKELYDNPDYDSKLHNHLHSELYEYCHSFYLSSDFMYLKEESLYKLLNFLLTHPVRNSISPSVIEALYTKHHLINSVTYFIFQLSDKSLNPDVIDSFMEYMKDTPSINLITLFLYRLNTEHIINNYPLKAMDSLTPKELFYGITTGYFSRAGLCRECISRLIALSADSGSLFCNQARERLNQLINEGFYINIPFNSQFTE